MCIKHRRLISISLILLHLLVKPFASSSLGNVVDTSPSCRTEHADFTTPSGF